MTNPWNWTAITVMLAVFSAIMAIRVYRWRADLQRIRAEAEEQRCSILTISWAWFPFFHGPFAGELHARSSRFYRVACRDQSGANRVAYVLIGPQGNFGWEFYGRLTWRWVKNLE